MGDASNMTPAPTEPQAVFPDPAVDRLARFLADLKADRTSAGWSDRMLDVTGLNAVLGTEEIMAAGRRHGQDLASSALVPARP